MKEPIDELLEWLHFFDDTQFSCNHRNVIEKIWQLKSKKQLSINGVMQAEPEKVCEHEDEYWIEDEGGDWYCGECDPVANF